MKRLLSLILSIILVLPCIVVNAEENQKFYSVNFDIGNGAISKKVIIKNEEIYLAANDFSDITRYSPNEDGTLFLVKGQELKKAFKSVVINKKDKKILVSGTHQFDLTDYFEIEGSTYLPLSQMLPILNAEIYEVKDNTIYISNNKLSLAEVLYDFDIADFYFNMSTEFNDSAWLTSWFIVPNYILNTIVDVRFDRLDIITHTGDYKDYKDIFSEFLADDNLYLKAKAQEDEVIGTTIDFFTKSNSTAKDMKDVYDWVEAAGETEIDSKTGGALLDSLKAYYDSGELKANDLKGLNDAWTKGDISFADCIEAVSYIYTYMNQVEDNRKMLDAVYNVTTSVSSNDAERKAAKQVYNLYGDKVIPAISQEIIEKVADDVVKDYINPIAIYTAIAKVAGVVLENVLPFSPSDISKLTLYSNTVLSASSKYYGYDTSTDNSTENLRLSLLLCLTASKKCFSIMDEVAKGTNSDDKYYENKIDKIEQLIMGLYIASDNLKLDSFEHYGDLKLQNLKILENSNILENLEEFVSNSNQVSLDNTYWQLSFGQTLGSSYIARFNEDGTMLACCLGSCTFSSGSYKYENDNLYITLKDANIDYDDATFVSNDLGFVSDKQYPMQVGTDYYRIQCAEKDIFMEYYNKYYKQNSSSTSNVSSQITNTTSSQSDNLVKLGKYKGFWVGVDENGYGYIILKEGGIFQIETNVDHTSGEIIDKINTTGTFTATEYEAIYPDGSKSKVTTLTLYIDGREFAVYEGDYDCFTDQWSGYEYVGN